MSDYGMDPGVHFPWGSIYSPQNDSCDHYLGTYLCFVAAVVVVVVVVLYIVDSLSVYVCSPLMLPSRKKLHIYID